MTKLFGKDILPIEIQIQDKLLICLKPIFTKWHQLKRQVLETASFIDSCKNCKKILYLFYNYSPLRAHQDQWVNCQWKDIFIKFKMKLKIQLLVLLGHVQVIEIFYVQVEIVNIIESITKKEIFKNNFKMNIAKEFFLTKFFLFQFSGNWKIWYLKKCLVSVINLKV